MEKSTGGCICTICTDEVDADTNCLQAICPCGHVFHQRCLQVWTKLGTADNRATSCPICNQNYETKDVLGLYFTDASRTDVFHSPASQRLSDRYRAQEFRKTIRKLEVEATILERKLKALEKINLEIERKGQGYAEELRAARAEGSKDRKENSRLAKSLARAQEQLRERTAHCEELTERGQGMAELLAEYKEASIHNLTLIDAEMVLLLSSCKDSAGYEDRIYVLSLARDVQKSRNKELKQKYQGLGIGAKQYPGHVTDEVKGMNPSMPGQIAKSQKENAEGRYFTRSNPKPVGFSYSDTAYKKPRLSSNDVNSGQSTNPSPSRPQAKSSKDDDRQGACRPSLASVQPNVICFES